MPLCYALYAALVGSLNGRRMFMHQAGLDMTFSTVRTIGIVGAAALGYGAATHELHAAAPTTQVASDPGTGSGGGG